MKPPDLKNALKRIRTIGTWWAAEVTFEHLETIRTYELGLVVGLLPPQGRVLEIGAGTGCQARALNKLGFEVSAIDIPVSNYRGHRVWPVTEYDGKIIPFEDGAFDSVFSSNVLEHIPHVREFQREIHRVLKTEGCVIHVLPSSSWRFWSTIALVLRGWRPPGAHGEHAGNSVIEIWFFSRRWWARVFQETGWMIVAERSTGLFYTGASLMDSRLSISTRRRLSRVFGSSCNIFVLRKSS